MPRSKEPARRLEELLKKLKSAQLRKIDWSACPPELRAGEANLATTLAPATALPPEEQALRKAFEESKLDHRNPHHWRLLLIYLANSCWTGGRRANWGPDEEHTLWLRADQFEGGDSEKIRRVQEGWPEDYGWFTAGALRKRLREARTRRQIS